MFAKHHCLMEAAHVSDFDKAFEVEIAVYDGRTAFAANAAHDLRSFQRAIASSGVRPSTVGCAGHSSLEQETE